MAVKTSMMQYGRVKTLREDEDKGPRLPHVCDQLAQIAKVVRVKEDDLVVASLPCC